MHCTHSVTHTHTHTRDIVRPTLRFPSSLLPSYLHELGGRLQKQVATEEGAVTFILGGSNTTTATSSRLFISLILLSASTAHATRRQHKPFQDAPFNAVYP